MTTKKTLFIVGGIVAVLGLVVALFVGGIMWVALSAIGNSEAAQTAKTFLRNNEKLKSDIGDVRDFGFWVTGNINSHNSDGEATLNLKVIGTKKTVPASVSLAYRSGREWVVVGASYRNDAGQTVELLEKYEQPHTAEAFLDYSEYIEELVDDDFDDRILNSDAPVLLTFTATSSAETSRLLPALVEVAQKYSRQVRFYVNYADFDPALSERSGVQVVPTLVLYRNGRERERVVGLRTSAELSRLIEKHLKK